MPLPNKSFTLDDFSAGIVSFTSGAGLLRLTKQPVAQETNTYRCCALPGGGLGPAPYFTTNLTIPTPVGLIASPLSIVGMETVGRIYGTNTAADTARLTALNDQVYVGVNWILSVNKSFEWWRILAATNTATSLARVDGDATAPSQPSPLFMTVSRLQASAASNGLLNQSVIASWEGGAISSASAFIRTYYFPDPASPTSATPVTDTDNSGALFAHQGRIIQLDNRIMFHGSGFTQTNECVNFTAPPLSTNMGDQNVLLSPTNPLGYGAWASMGDEGFVLVKTSGGLVIVHGDLMDQPQVTFQQSVIGTGQVMAPALVTPIGVVYFSDRSIYVWDGTVSTNISRQLRDGFFNRTEPAPWSLNQRYLQMTMFGDYVMFPHGFFYDMINKSWWKIEDTAVFDAEVWSASKSTTTRAYASKGSYAAAGTNQIRIYDSTVASAPSYSWQSHPITVTDRRWVDVREIEVVASPSSGAISTVTVTVTGLGGTTQAETFTFTEAGQPMRLRKVTSVQGYNLIVRIEAASNGSNAAPVVHAVTLSYHDTHTSAGV